MLKKLTFILAVFLVAGTGFLVWREYISSVRAERIEAEILKGLTEEDVRMLLESQKQSDLETVQTISSTPEARRLFLDGLREHLSLAAAARREGLAEDKNFKRNLDYKENILLAELYRSKVESETGKPFVVPKEDLEAILNVPQNAENVSADLAALRQIQIAVSKVKDHGFVPAPLQGEALKRAQENWARTKLLSDMAKADKEFINRPELGLRFRVLEAGILSSDYLRAHWDQNVKATEKEIADFLKGHPEYDLAEKSKLAEQVMTRAISGEDFAALVKEYSEHRPSKISGGSMDVEAATGDWAELVAATANLKPGEFVSRLVRSEYGVHIVRLVERRGVGTPNEVVTVEHILFQNKFEQPQVTNPDIPAPFMTPLEIAQHEIEKAKRSAFVASVVERNPVEMPADFKLS